MSSSDLHWAGVDSNHRRLAPTDLQSVPFSHSGTYPYYFFNLPLMGFEPMASPLPRECATPAPQRLNIFKVLFYCQQHFRILPRECCYPPPTPTILNCCAGPCHKGSISSKFILLSTSLSSKG